jgi:hypothetical protein
VTGHDDADEREARERWIELGIRVDIPHPARVYDYMLGGQDNISQVASRCPYSGRTLSVQARHANF